jgi:hypothetical protein
MSLAFVHVRVDEAARRPSAEVAIPLTWPHRRHAGDTALSSAK